MYDSRGWIHDLVLDTQFCSVFLRRYVHAVHMLMRGMINARYKKCAFCYSYMYYNIFLNKMGDNLYQIIVQKYKHGIHMQLSMANNPKLLRPPVPTITSEHLILYAYIYSLYSPCSFGDVRQNVHTSPVLTLLYKF